MKSVFGTVIAIPVPIMHLVPCKWSHLPLICYGDTMAWCEPIVILPRTVEVKSWADDSSSWPVALWIHRNVMQGQAWKPDVFTNYSNIRSQLCIWYRMVALEVWNYCYGLSVVLIYDYHCALWPYFCCWLYNQMHYTRVRQKNLSVSEWL
jgi:hypothetical protein